MVPVDEDESGGNELTLELLTLLLAYAFLVIAAACGLNWLIFDRIELAGLFALGSGAMAALFGSLNWYCRCVARPESNDKN